MFNLKLLVRSSTDCCDSLPICGEKYKRPDRQHMAGWQVPLSAWVQTVQADRMPLEIPMKPVRTWR